MSIEIRKRISPYNNQSRYSEAVKFIVVHYVGAVSTARNNADYFYRTNTLQTAYGGASAHFFVDEDSIWQSVSEDRAAWHCGGPLQGSGGHSFFQICTNRNSIGIEMCVIRDKKGRYIVKEGTVNNTAKLVQHLMKKYGITKDHVIRHYDVTGKECPAAYPEYAPTDYLLNSSAWARFRDRLVGEVAKSEITLVKANFPTVLLKGERFVIKGKVKSLQKLKSVTVVVEKKNGEDIKEATKKRYTSARTYDLARIDPYIAFRQLKVGEYVYKVKATDIYGESKVLLRKPFSVIKEGKKK